MIFGSGLYFRSPFLLWNAFTNLWDQYIHVVTRHRTNGNAPTRHCDTINVKLPYEDWNVIQGVSVGAVVAVRKTDNPNNGIGRALFCGWAIRQSWRKVIYMGMGILCTVIDIWKWDACFATPWTKRSQVHLKAVLRQGIFYRVISRWYVKRLIVGHSHLIWERCRVEAVEAVQWQGEHLPKQYTFIWYIVLDKKVQKYQCRA